MPHVLLFLILLGYVVLGIFWFRIRYVAERLKKDEEYLLKSGRCLTDMFIRLHELELKQKPNKHT
jgi:uncharacterized membrane protein